MSFFDFVAKVPDLTYKLSRERGGGRGRHDEVLQCYQGLRLIGTGCYSMLHFCHFLNFRVLCYRRRSPLLLKGSHDTVFRKEFQCYEILRFKKDSSSIRFCSPFLKFRLALSQLPPSFSNADCLKCLRFSSAAGSFFPTCSPSSADLLSDNPQLPTFSDSTANLLYLNCRHAQPYMTTCSPSIVYLPTLS